MIDTVIVEVPHPGHPYGVRGVGETAIVPPLGGIANAVFEPAPPDSEVFILPRIAGG